MHAHAHSRPRNANSSRRGRRVPIPPANRRDPFGTDWRVTHRGVALKGWTDAGRLEAAHSVEPGTIPRIVRIERDDLCLCVLLFVWVGF